MALHVTRLRNAACSSTDMSQGRTWSNERLRLRSRSSPPDEDRRRSPPRNRRRPARRHRPARRLLPVPAARPRPLVLGYSPTLGEVGTLVPALLPVFPTAPGRRPRRPRPAAAAERARPGRPHHRLPGPPPGQPTRRHSTEAGPRRSRADGTIATSQLAIVTRRSLPPPSCPPSERRRAGHPTHHCSSIQVK